MGRKGELMKTQFKIFPFRIMKMTRNQCNGSIRISNSGFASYSKHQAIRCRNSLDEGYNILSTAIPIRMRIRKIMEDGFYYHEE